MIDAPEPAPSIHIEVAPQVDTESRDAVIAGLREFNRQHLGTYEWTGFDVYARDRNGRVIGGLIGDIALGWLSVHALWVTEELRGSGIGSRILQSAEDTAAQRGCRAVILDTFTFQAPAFYEKHGYLRIGVVDDYRGGVQRIFLQKRLTSRTPAS